jgi:hypothetical protein
MFRWYCDAQVCYAFLEDLSPDIPPTKDTLAACKWFTRGWTLQELIAPKTVKVFARSWTEVGERDEIKTALSVITGIREEILGLHHHDFSVGTHGSVTRYQLLHCELEKLNIAERMSWASQRQTTRKEDLAYYLLRIFDINMPLLYGEGDKSFIRPQEEIVKKSTDQSIFAWTYESWLAQGPDIPFQIFAPHPWYFRDGQTVAVCSFGHAHGYELTNADLRIKVPVLTIMDALGESRTYRALACRYRCRRNGLIALPVALSPDGNAMGLTRHLGKHRIVTDADLKHATRKSVTISRGQLECQPPLLGAYTTADKALAAGCIELEVLLGRCPKLSAGTKFTIGDTTPSCTAVRGVHDSRVMDIHAPIGLVTIPSTLELCADFAVDVNASDDASPYPVYDLVLTLTSDSTAIPNAAAASTMPVAHQDPWILVEACIRCQNSYTFEQTIELLPGDLGENGKDIHSQCNFVLPFYGSCSTQISTMVSGETDASGNLRRCSIRFDADLLKKGLPLHAESLASDTIFRTDLEHMDG